MRPLGRFGCLAGGALAFLVSAASANAQTLSAVLQADVRGASDNPLTGRYAGSTILAQTVKAFDEIRLPNGPAEGKTFSNDKKFSALVTAQGKVMRTIYLVPAGRSSLEVMTNFVDAVSAKGFAAVFQCAADACGESFPLLKYRWDKPETKVLGENYDQLRRLTIDAAFDQLIDLRYALFKKSAPEGDSYVALYAGLHRGGSFGDYSKALSDRVGVLVETVEPRAMEKRMEVVSAGDIGNKVMAEGKAVFYDILFDFDKADIKPKSEPQLAEMAKFLQANPAINVYVVGHTDNKGALDYNVNLSGRRSDAVVKALVARYRVNPQRMTPRGLGPLAPVASNRAEDGRAKNRRVEMVEQ